MYKAIWFLISGQIGSGELNGFTRRPMRLDQIPSALSASPTSRGEVTCTAVNPRARAPSTFSARSSKNTMRLAGTPMAVTT
jgi:hypothetical protein